MNSLVIKNIEIGSGIPKICVPIVGKTIDEIIADGNYIKLLPVDIVEWRADYFEDVFDTKALLEALKEIREIFVQKPILFTLRTKNEGGERDFDLNEYRRINLAVIRSGLVDVVDIEGFLGDEFVKEIIDEAHSWGVKIITSNHDFTQTPSKSEIIYRLLKMQSLGGDALKIAVMPKTNLDVLVLIEATEEMNRLYGEVPIISASMSGIGLISRLGGEIFGSAMTYGAGNKKSAPGQIQAEDLKKILTIMHNNL